MDNITKQRLLAALDLLSLVVGLCGSLLLAFAVGTPPGIPPDKTGFMIGMAGSRYPIAFVIADRWRWGVMLIVLAFVLQLPRVWMNFISAMRRGGKKKGGNAAAKIQSWRKEFETIYNDVVDLHHKRHIFRDTMEIIQGNSILQAKGGHVFENWLVENYAVTLAVGIRRQGWDRASDVVSMAKLIDDIKNNATILTRDWFVNEYLANAPANDLAFWKYSANRDFDKFAPNGAPNPSISLIRADQDRLQSLVGRVRHFVNKRLAHYSTKGYQGPVTFKEVHDALDELGALLQRYSLLLKQAGLLGPEPIIQEDWQAVLRVPWIQ